MQRWRKTDANTLELKMVAEDPQAFTGKIESSALMKQTNDQEILEAFCEAPGFGVNDDGTFSSAPSLYAK